MKQLGGPSDHHFVSVASERYWGQTAPPQPRCGESGDAFGPFDDLRRAVWSGRNEAVARNSFRQVIGALSIPSRIAAA
jgi:hypothetical protein